MNLPDILKRLYAGAALKITFPDDNSREAARMRLYKLKKTQDKFLTDILDEDRQVLRFQVSDLLGDETDGVVHILEYSATLWLAAKIKPDFAVLDITEQVAEQKEKSQSANGLDTKTT
jgi:hypothetical protein